LKEGARCSEKGGTKKKKGADDVQNTGGKGGLTLEKTHKQVRTADRQGSYDGKRRSSSVGEGSARTNEGGNG